MFWAYSIISNVLLWFWPQIWHAHLICESKINCYNKLFWECQLICNILVLANIAFALLTFCLSGFIYSFNDKYSSRMTLKSVPLPDLFRYCLNSMGAQKNAPKNVLVTFFPYIFHIKTKWNIVYRYLKTKIFSRDINILPRMHWTSNIFGHSATTITKLSNPSLQENGMPPKSLDAAL